MWWPGVARGRNASSSPPLLCTDHGVLRTVELHLSYTHLEHTYDRKMHRMFLLRCIGRRLTRNLQVNSRNSIKQLHKRRVDVDHNILESIPSQVSRPLSQPG